MKYIKSLSTSKRLLVVNYLIGIILIICITIGTFKKIDVSDLVTLVNTVWVEIGAASVSYYMKSKAENKIKLLNSLKPELLNKVDINNLFS